MKKRYFVFIVFLFFFAITNVYAGDKYDVKTLISIKTTADVSTDIYNYRNIKYVDKVEDKKYGMFEIDSITNNSKIERPYAINIFLFNKKQKNIGYVSYCSSKDLEGDYAQLMLGSKAKSYFTVPIDKKYFGKGYDRSDLAYFAIDENNGECVVGNVDKYLGLTLYDISQGDVSPKYNENSFMNKIYGIVNKGLFNFLFDLLVLVSIYTSISMLTGYLHKLMYNKFSLLSWVPLLHFIASMRVSFGRIIAFLYFVLMLIGGIALVFDFYLILLGCVLLMFVSIIINIFKVVTGYYKLFYLDPFTSYEWQKKQSYNPLKNTYATPAPIVDTQALIDEASGGYVHQNPNIMQSVGQPNTQPVVAPVVQPVETTQAAPIDPSIPQSISIAGIQIGGVGDIKEVAAPSAVDKKEQKRLEKEAIEAERERMKQEKEKQEEVHTINDESLDKKPELINSLFGNREE